MKHRISPATLIACVALFVALGGTSWAAASHYLITSTSQIKPSVLRHLKGDRGPRGLTGRQGTQGVAGQAASISQPSFYVRHSGPAMLDSATHVATTLDTFCDPDSRIVTGGYDGQNEIVTADEPLSGNPVTPWVVSAHLEQGTTSGAVTGWVLCERR